MSNSQRIDTAECRTLSLVPSAMAAARASDDLPSNATALTALRIADRFTLGDTWRLIQDGYKLGLEHGVYSVSLAPYDHHRAGICYSVRGVAPDQRCAILNIDVENKITMGTTPAGVPSSLTITPTPASVHLRAPCRFARFAGSAVSTSDRAVACCQRPKWLAWRDLQCSLLTVSSWGQLRVDEELRPWRASTVRPWRTPVPLALVQLDFERALACYYWTADNGEDLGDGQVVTCDELGVSRPEYWWPSLGGGSRLRIEGLDSGRNGFFALAPIGNGEAVGCYRNNGGTLSCRRIKSRQRADD